MRKRQSALAEAKVAGYHENTGYFTRLLVEARVNRGAMNAAYQAGYTARAMGVKCACTYCLHTGQYSA